MKDKPVKPRRIDVNDFPRDKRRVLSYLREPLKTAFNYCRKRPENMATLRKTLMFVVGRIDDFITEEAKYQLAYALETANGMREPDQLEAFARNFSIELDKRQNINKMYKAFESALYEQTKTTLEQQRVEAGISEPISSPEPKADATNTNAPVDTENSTTAQETATTADSEATNTKTEQVTE